VSLLNTLYPLLIDNKAEIAQYLSSNKEAFLRALSKALESCHLLNKLKATKLFKTLCTNEFFNIDEIKGILAFIRIEYRKQFENLEFIRDMLMELLEVSNNYPYEVNNCFGEDIQTQYNDFQALRNENSTANELYNAKNSLGNSVEMFFAELEIFCRTKECLGDILFLCASEFYTNLYVNNEWQHIWTKEYLETACRIVDDTKLGQDETDEIVEKMMEKVFTESKNVFTTSESPVFMSKEYAEPFYHLLKQSAKTLSYKKAEILLSEIIKVFSEFAPEFESRVKCYDKV